MPDKISSSKGVQGPSAVTVSMIEHLTKQQGIIIKLMEEIAHGAKQEKEDNGILAEAVQSNESCSSDDQHRPDPEIMTKRLKLYRAARNGDWQAAKSIYDVHKELIGDVISKNGYTDLHIAAASERMDFVKELVKMSNENHIICKTPSGVTALSFAAASGNLEIARELMGKNKAVAMVPDVQDDLPIHMAALLGRKEMVKYLYEETKDELKEKDLIQLLVASIKAEFYDVALQLLKDHKELAVARSKNGETALHALALKRLPSSDEEAGFLRRCINLVPGIKNVENGKHTAVELVERLWEEVLLLGEPKISNLIASPSKLIFTATEKGNDRFLSILIREYPDLIWKVDNADHLYSIFHTAVLYRQKNIFKLISDIGSTKHLLIWTTDNDDNNILHLAGKLASHRLKTATGPAFQLQSELSWFKEVSKIVQPSFRQEKNNDGLTPWELFVKEHEELREKGEKWLKESAEACMVVAALIATVAFAAAITVPGGNKGDTGFPFFLQKVSFQIFAISDALSLAFSSISMVAFLSIFTSRHAQEDFLFWSPTKLNVGLATLFISIAAMMIMFCATFFTLFKERKLWIAILVTVISSVPVFLFISQLLTTTGPASLFKRGKNELFRKEGEAAELKEVKEYNARLPIRFPCSTIV